MNNQSKLTIDGKTITGYDEAHLFVNIEGGEVIGNTMAIKLRSKQGKVGWPVTFSYSTKPAEDEYLWLDKETFLEAGAVKGVRGVNKFITEAAYAKLNEEDTLESVTIRTLGMKRLLEVTFKSLDFYPEEDLVYPSQYNSNL